jgi:hypothetical protein
LRLKVFGIITALGIAALWCGGCNRSDNKKPIVLNPTTRQTKPATTMAPATQASPTTQGATTQVAKKTSQMLVNGVVVDFPEAKLVIKKDGERHIAFLCSNDPPEVINPSYQGNRYYFEMALDDLEDLKKINLAEFRYKAGTAEPNDSPHGIFLDGDRQHFQPFDIQVAFDRDGESDKVIVQLQGQFLYFPKGSVMGQQIAVMAQLPARLEKR